MIITHLVTAKYGNSLPAPPQETQVWLSLDCGMDQLQKMEVHLCSLAQESLPDIYELENSNLEKYILFNLVMGAGKRNFNFLYVMCSAASSTPGLQ